MRVYLAGPEVFLPDPMAAAKAKQAICEKYGFVGLFPLDNALDLASMAPFEAGLAIYKSNIALMDRCDLIIANMTPFRGCSMDVGTAFEMGYMAGQGKPIFGYSNDGRFYHDRVPTRTPGLDENGQTIEFFEMHDNLMLEGAIDTSGGVFIGESIAPEGYFTDLRSFEQVVKLAGDRLLNLKTTS